MSLLYPFDARNTPPAAANVATFNDARAMNAAASGFVTIAGQSAPHDGYGGVFAWDATSTDADDNLYTLAVSSQPGVGRWKRVADLVSGVDVRRFGADPTGVGDSSTAIQTAINSAVSSSARIVYFPPGFYKVTQPIYCHEACSLIGTHHAPPGGTAGVFTGFPTIKHDFAGDLFTFDAQSDVHGIGYGKAGSGGGVQGLRLVQTHQGGTSRAIVVTGTDTHDPNWLRFADLCIEEDGVGVWDRAIVIDGSATTSGGAGGVGNCWIHNVNTHTTGAYSLELRSAASFMVNNCQFFLSGGNVLVDGTSDVPSAGQFVQSLCQQLDLDHVSDMGWWGGLIVTPTITANTGLTGRVVLMPSKMRDDVGGTNPTNSRVFVSRFVVDDLGAPYNFWEMKRHHCMDKGVVLYGRNQSSGTPVQCVSVDGNGLVEIDAGAAGVRISHAPAVSGAAGNWSAPNLWGLEAVKHAGGTTYTLIESTFGNSLDTVQLGNGAQSVKMAAGVADTETILTYSASIAVDASLGNAFGITITNGTGFTIVTPTNPTAGQRIRFVILNSSGGSAGALTWDTGFMLAGAWTQPADTKRRTIEFTYNATAAKWVELSRAAADI